MNKYLEKIAAAPLRRFEQLGRAIANRQRGEVKANVLAGTFEKYKDNLRNGPLHPLATKTQAHLLTNTKLSKNTSISLLKGNREAFLFKGYNEARGYTPDRQPGTTLKDYYDDYSNPVKYSVKPFK